MDREVIPPTIKSIYVSRYSGFPMESLENAWLLPGKGIEGDRYANGKGTYSAKFMYEPGQNLTMVSLEGVQEAMKRTGMKPFPSSGSGGDDDSNSLGAQMRRNLVLQGISNQALNDMVGHEVRIGNGGARLFVHRRCIPCRYREAACRRPGLMNNLWGACGVNCEVLSPPPPPSFPGMPPSFAGMRNQPKKDSDEVVAFEIKVGDTVTVVPASYQPERINVGRRKPGTFIRPADRSLEDVQRMITPPWTAALASLWDPDGFQRVEDAYRSVGLKYWSARAYSLGKRAMLVRNVFLTALSLLVFVIVVRLALYLGSLNINTGTEF